ncbi:hemicentin-1-like isoform X2 [Oratosquilla oratoria]|uniref:hemicentin-1-like isoform X2 n=1 Tax=Oratosquilla oratoria TaxID=337810 RepID=UPI003F76DC1B
MKLWTPALLHTYLLVLLAHTSLAHTPLMEAVTGGDSLIFGNDNTNTTTSEGNGITRGRHRRRSSYNSPGPVFDTTTPTNITTQLGTHAYLPCRIKNLGNKSVSWIRNRDSHILTVDRYTFIADERFQAWHEASTETWTLQVKYVQARDAGSYECQVSTEPKMSHFMHLTVITPKVTIAGESDIYVKSGSTVTIQCVISASLEEPNYIFWYHDSKRVVPFAAAGREVTVERVSSDTTVGTLTISSVTMKDSGNFTCSPASLDTAYVTLHVINGEHPAAMQHGTSHAPGQEGGVVALLLHLSFSYVTTSFLHSIIFALHLCIPNTSVSFR